MRSQQTTNCSAFSRMETSSTASGDPILWGCESGSIIHVPLLDITNVLSDCVVLLLRAHFMVYYMFVSLQFSSAVIVLSSSC